MNDDPSFSKSDLSDISPKDTRFKNKTKIDKNKVLDVIRDNSPLSIWRLKELTEVGYSTLWNIIRELEFVGLVETEPVINESNRNERIIRIPGGSDEIS